MNDPFKTYRASLNKYAYFPLTLDPLLNNQSNLNDKLCEIAGMEGWHDHHGIFGLSSNAIEASVKEYTPEGCIGTAPFYSEEKYLSSVLTVDPTINPPPKPNVVWKESTLNPPVNKVDEEKWYGTNTDPSSQYATWLNNFSAHIKARYIIARVILNKEAGIEHSKVQKCFNMNGITDSIYILRDVAYGNWGRDIKRWGLNPSLPAASTQYIYNVQTSSGIYDPGPSLSYFSGAGIKCGYSDINGKSRYGLFNCSFPAETILDYPAFIKSNPISSAEQLMYTKYNCKLFGDNTIVPNDTTSDTTSDEMNIANPVTSYKDAEKMIDSAAVNLIVEVPDVEVPNTNKLYIVTKYTSNKASSLLDLPFVSACIAYSASADVIDIAKSTYTFENYNIIKRSGPLKIMTKKFGDSGIAIQTLRPKLDFYAFEPTASGNTVTIEQKESNGIHAFLTYDQVATAAAIEYGAPVVIYTTHEYAIIFISNTIKDKLSTPEQRLINVRNSIKDPFTDAYTEGTAATTAADSDTAAAAAAAAATAADNASLYINNTLLGKIPSPLVRVNSTKYDIVYRDYLSFWYKLAPLIKIYNDAKKAYTILNSTKTDIVNAYVNAKNTAGSDITLINDIGTLTTISNSYRNYSNMIKTYTSIKDTLTHVETSVTILTQFPNKIKIGDASKIIGNCDPYNGTYKEQRIRKILTCFRGQAESGLELGMSIIIEIYENLSGDKMQDYFRNQLINLFTQISKSCAENLKPKLLLSFDFIPDAPINYRNIFVSTEARAQVTSGAAIPMTLGGAMQLKRDAFDMLNSTANTDESETSTNSSLKSLTPDSSSRSTKLTLGNTSDMSSIPPPNVTAPLFDKVTTKLTELILQVDKLSKEHPEDAAILVDIKPLLEATKSVIQTQGSKYISTLSSPLSYEHLEADALIHQPLFIYSFLQTILEYSSVKDTNTTDLQLSGGGPKPIPSYGSRRGDTNRGSRIVAEDVVPYPAQNPTSQPINRGVDMDGIFSNVMTRSRALPFKKGGLLEQSLPPASFISNLQPQIYDRVFLLTTTSNPNITTITRMMPTILLEEQYVVVYGHIITIQDLIRRIKDVSVKYRSIDTELVDKSNIPTNPNPIIIDDVTTSYSITNSIMLRKQFDTDFSRAIEATPDPGEPVIDAPQGSDLFTEFIYYTNKVSHKDENSQLVISKTSYDILHGLLTQLLYILTNTLQVNASLTDYDNALNAIFPITYVPISPPRGGKNNKKTIRKPKKPKTNKHAKSKRKYAKSKKNRTTKQILKSKARKPKQTRP